jgi:hypothetical protein
MCQRCEELEEEVVYLRSEMGLQQNSADIAAIRMAFRVSPCSAKLLLALYRAKGRPVSPYQLLEAMPPRYDRNDGRDPQMIAVLVSKIRKALGHDFIRTERTRGLHLPREAMNVLAVTLGEATPALAGPEIQDINDRPSEELRVLVAHIAGHLAHRDGDGGTETAKTFRRIADRLTGEPRRAA